MWSVCSVVSYWVKGRGHLESWVAVLPVCQQSYVDIEHAGYSSLPILRLNSHSVAQAGLGLSVLRLSLLNAGIIGMAIGPGFCYSHVTKWFCF